MFNDWKGIGLAVTWNPAIAEELFEGSGHTFAEIAALGKDRKPLPHFPLTMSIKAKAKQINKQVELSEHRGQAAGLRPATEASQYVVLSAHLDHLGIGEPINGDKIYNGAMDNASGSALVLDIADQLHAAGAEAEALAAVPVPHGGREGPAGLTLLRQQADGAEEGHCRRPEHRHVPADLSAEDCDCVRAR